MGNKASVNVTVLYVQHLYLSLWLLSYLKYNFQNKNRIFAGIISLCTKLVRTLYPILVIHSVGWNHKKESQLLKYPGDDYDQNQVKKF